MNLEIITVRKFLRLFRGVGKTTGMIENIKSFLDEQLLVRKDIKIGVIVESKDTAKILSYGPLSYYKDNIVYYSMKQLLNALSQLNEKEEVPLDHALFLIDRNNRIDKVFIDPSCFEILCLEQLDKLQEILNIIGGIK